MKKKMGYCTTFFAALSNPLRVRILQRLAERPATVGSLAEGLGSERSLISHNLALLSKAELVAHTKAGNTRVYNINESVVPHIFFFLDRLVCSSCSLRQTCVVLRERHPEMEANFAPPKRIPCKGCER